MSHIHIPVSLTSSAFLTDSPSGICPAHIRRVRSRTSILQEVTANQLLYDEQQDASCITPAYPSTLGEKSAGRSHGRKPRSRHPVDRLPSELLASIFMLGPEHDTEFPMVVSHVCSLWRKIAIYTPRLWCRISLDWREAMWKERIFRAKACLLDVDLTSRTDGSGCLAFPDGDDAHLCLSLITPYIRQWRSLSLSFIHYSPFLWNTTLSQLCSSPNDHTVHAPWMQSLSLVYPGNDDTKEFTLFGGIAPCLSNVTLVGIRLTWLPSLFGNLIVLDYTHHSFSSGSGAVMEVLAMLEVSNQLESLSITFPRGGQESIEPTLPMPDPWNTVFLSRLQKLCLRVNSHQIPVELSCVVSNLTMPSLVELELAADETHRSLSPDSIISALVPFHLHSKLASIRIANEWFYTRCIFHLISTLPNLCHLSAAGPNVDDAFLIRLAHALPIVEESSAKRWKGKRKTQVALPCPKLQTLELVGCSKATVAGVWRLIERRTSKRLPVCLQTLRIRQCRQLGFQVVARTLQAGVDVQERQDGLEISTKISNRTTSAQRL